jgi:hypothetical protein
VLRAKGLLFQHDHQFPNLVLKALDWLLGLIVVFVCFELRSFPW